MVKPEECSTGFKISAHPVNSTNQLVRVILIGYVEQSCPALTTQGISVEIA